MENEVKEISHNNALSENREVLKELNLNKSEQLNISIEKSNTSKITETDPFDFEKMSQFENLDKLVNISATTTNTEDPLQLNFEDQPLDSLPDMSANQYMLDEILKDTVDNTAGSGNETVTMIHFETCAMDCAEDLGNNIYANMSFEPMDIDESFDENACEKQEFLRSLSFVDAVESKDNTTMSFKDANETNTNKTIELNDLSTEKETERQEPFSINEMMKDSKPFPTSPNSLSYVDGLESKNNTTMSFKDANEMNTNKTIELNDLSTEKETERQEPFSINEMMKDSKPFPTSPNSLRYVDGLESKDNTAMSFKDANQMNTNKTIELNDFSTEKEKERHEPFPINKVVEDSKHFPTSPNSVKKSFEFATSPKFNKESTSFSICSNSLMETHASALTLPEFVKPIEDLVKHELQINDEISCEPKTIATSQIPLVKITIHEDIVEEEMKTEIEAISINEEVHFGEKQNSLNLEQEKQNVEEQSDANKVIEEQKSFTLENENNQQILNSNNFDIQDSSEIRSQSPVAELKEQKSENLENEQKIQQIDIEECSEICAHVVELKDQKSEMIGENQRIENKETGEIEISNTDDIKLIVTSSELEKTISMNSDVALSCENLCDENNEFEFPSPSAAAEVAVDIKHDKTEQKDASTLEAEKNIEEKYEFKIPSIGDNSEQNNRKGNFLEVKKEIFAKNQQVGDFKIPFQQLGSFGDSEFGGNIILDPADFDYLLTKGNTNVEIDRNSILLRFDPLLGAAVPVNLNKQHCLDDILNATKQHLRNSTLTPTGEEPSSEKLINTTIKEESKCQIRHTPNVATHQIMSTNATVETEKERIVLNYKMDELESKIKNEVLKTEDVERKLKEAEQREESLIKRITEKDKLINKQNGVIEAYERAIAEFVSEKEHLVQNYEKQLVEVKADRDANFRHLSSLETTFSDLHVKFEKSKAMTQQLQASQELLTEERKKALDNLRQQEQRYLKMKNHAMEQLEIANKKLESLTREHHMELTKFKALLKKEEITRASINEQLAQKSRENEELMKICDELINGGSS